MLHRHGYIIIYIFKMEIRAWLVVREVLLFAMLVLIATMTDDYSLSMMYSNTPFRHPVVYSHISLFSSSTHETAERYKLQHAVKYK